MNSKGQETRSGASVRASRRPAEKVSVSGQKSGRKRNNLAIIEAGKAIQKQVPT
ncbi:hypothetical protein HMPREF3293_00068 [Christensenella minuta]|uniref:Uncharacterized protein n=1 Tax=Christensenella minuta TaxID=626937 RepID=A0A136Q8Q5_9FIRM|nr:hypothetical protein HMPREF3293_00068 [Christensenella minuta]